MSYAPMVFTILISISVMSVIGMALWMRPANPPYPDISNIDRHATVSDRQDDQASRLNRAGQR